jgi:hypothetical protein
VKHNCLGLISTTSEKIKNHSQVTKTSRIFTFCPYTGDIFAKNNERQQLYKNIYKIGYVRASSFSLRGISVVSVYFTFSGFFCHTIGISIFKFFKLKIIEKKKRKK